MLPQRGDEKSQVTMSDSQKTEPPTIVINQRDAVTTPSKSGRLTKKHVLIAVVSLVIAGLMVVAVLVGIHLVMQGNEETLRLSLTMKNAGGANVQQNVSTDDNANVVMSHVVVDGSELFIYDDFDKGIQLFKVLSASTVGCYITPLNRSNAFDPKLLPQLADRNISSTDMNSSMTVHLSYDVAPTPINDTTFLGKRANALCNNVPVYWLQPTCSGPVVEYTMAGSTGRSKRSFSCKCGWKYCSIRIFGRKYSFICGYECGCCLNSWCVTVDTTCALCLGYKSWNLCANVCRIVG